MLELEKHIHESRVPVVSVNDIRPKIHRLQEVEHRSAEEGETLRVVIVAVKPFAIEIFLIVDEVIRHAVELVLVKADVFLAPGHGELAVIDVLHRVPVRLGNLAEFRHDHPHIHAIGLECLRQGACNICQSPRLGKRNSLCCNIKNLHLTHPPHSFAA